MSLLDACKILHVAPPHDFVQVAFQRGGASSLTLLGTDREPVVVLRNFDGASGGNVLASILNHIVQTGQLAHTGRHMLAHYVEDFNHAAQNGHREHRMGFSQDCRQLQGIARRVVSFIKDNMPRVMMSPLWQQFDRDFGIDCTFNFLGPDCVLPLHKDASH